MSNEWWEPSWVDRHFPAVVVGVCIMVVLLLAGLTMHAEKTRCERAGGHVEQLNCRCTGETEWVGSWGRVGERFTRRPRATCVEVCVGAWGEFPSAE